MGGGQTVRLDLGIEPEDQVDFTYPFPVKIDVTNIGGPSAGLAMTLGVIDALTNGSVTGGHTVAATGTIDSPGTWATWAGWPRRRWRWRMPAPPSSWCHPRSTRRPCPRSGRDCRSTPSPPWTRRLQVLAAHGGRCLPSRPGPARRAPGAPTAG